MAALIGCLTQLRAEINAAWPNRDKSSDGWIGDTAHQARASDHNPDANGVVHAIDVDVDGIPAAVLVAYLVRLRSPRLSYIIHDRRIWSASHGWVGRAYTGTDPHTGHIHISSTHTSAAAITASWGIADRFAPTPASQEDDDMVAIGSIRIPRGFAYCTEGLVDATLIEARGLPAGTKSGWPVTAPDLSVSCDPVTPGVPRVRVAIHDGAQWHVRMVDIKPGRNKVDVPPAASGEAYVVAVGRIRTGPDDQTGDIPASLDWVVGRR